MKQAMNNETRRETMKTAEELVVGDKVKCGEIIAAVEGVRTETRTRQYTQMSGTCGTQTYSVKIIKVETQPEIEAGNLQSFIDQGIVELI
jgi:hypothetical protein